MSAAVQTAGDPTGEYKMAAEQMGSHVQDSAKTSHDESSLEEGMALSDDRADSDSPAFQKQSLATIMLLATTSVMAMFLVALDRTIITTAIPDITNDFNSLPDIGWYASAYLMTCGACQLFFGKIYSMFAVKPVFLISILLFEIGSAVCGAAPTSVAFIIGRAIAGIGAAGILAGSVVTVTRIVPLKQQPAMNGLLGVIFAIAIILGPLIGGAFTSNVSWRWCFYINLPIGGVVILIRAFTIKVPNSKPLTLTWPQKLLQLDPLGAICLVPGVICLVLALQWGGQEYAWSNGRVVATLTLMGVLLIGFVVVEALLPKTALAPPRLFKQRSVVAGLWQMFFVGAGMYVIIYYLPLWFQSVKGDSPVQAGVKLLPTMLSMLVSSVLFGGLVQKIGYYTPVGIVGSAIMSVGAGLLLLLDVDSGHSEWIGYQVVFGFGMGLSMQTPTIAVQTILSVRDVPIGIGLVFFGQLIGGAIGVPIGTNIFNRQLISKLTGIPGFTPSLVTSGGATSLVSALPAAERAAVLLAYNDAIRDAFKVGVILTALSFLGSASMEWRSTKETDDKEKTENEKEASYEQDTGGLETATVMF